MPAMPDPFWLVLPPRLWQDGVRGLVQSGWVGVARLTRNFHAGRRELVAREMLPVGPTIRGDYFGPLDDLLLIELRDQVTADDARRLVDRFDPLGTQLVAAVVFGRAGHAGRWAGGVFQSNEIHPLTGLTLVGPGMRSFFADSEPREKGDRSNLCAAPSRPFRQIGPVPFFGRWSRTRGALGDAAFRRLRSSTVAVVGASRNGSLAATMLTMLGVRRLVLIDNDDDDLHLLDAVLNATIADVGRPKVTNRAAVLGGMREDDFEIVPLAKSVLDPAAIEHLRQVDLLVTCVDRDPARLAVATLANRWGKVHLDVGSGIFAARTADHVGTYSDLPQTAGNRRMGGDVRLLLPGEACVACLGGLRDLSGAEHELSAPQHSLLTHRPVSDWREQRAGSLVTVNATAVSVAIQLWLDLLTGRLSGSCWCRLEWSDRGELRVETNLRPSPLCTICGRGIRELLAVGNSRRPRAA